ncbi:MAG TPA: asparaginase [Candidatus Cloacimonadota bacterium]|nr:asparaginase [Candidatus Cloacimonadota bacterium]HPT73192.1 asparaginase [Candidatus Cloacimonadota bacterium]
MKNILIILTGGTIGMKSVDPQGVVPSKDFADFLRSFPQMNSVAEIEILEFANIPSPYMTPDMMMEIAKLIESKATSYDGVVITHGTDTLEETAYLLDLVLKSDIPVILTAAMRSGSEIGLDGPRNIINAVRVACSHGAIGQGVLVVMNDEIHTARDVVKSDTGKLEAFVSEGYGILGIIDPDKVIFYRKALHRDVIHTDKLDTNVDLIKATAGMDDRYIECSIEHHAKAIVIEAFGRGNLPENLMPVIRKALDKGILVVVVSRTNTGRVLPEYGYKGGGLYLQRMGVILGGDLRGPKARLKLMALFGKYENAEHVKDFFIHSIV